MRSSKTFHLGPSPGGVPVNAEPVSSDTPEEGPPVALGGGIWGHVYTPKKQTRAPLLTVSLQLSAESSVAQKGKCSLLRRIAPHYFLSALLVER